METIIQDAGIQKAIHDFIYRDITDKPANVNSDPFWKNLQETETEIWLDTGDIDQVRELWSAEMSALTTNNTLLNNEIQKGIYDDYIRQAKSLVKDLPLKQQVMEIAFMLNARHGLRLAHIFNTRVSVELHTDTAHDFDAILYYGKRLYAINPDSFLIKVPYTATGLIAARQLREIGIPVNLTLGFSARQNALATMIARPAYVNVFLGRLDAYFKSNGIEGINSAGVKATRSTLRMVRDFRSKYHIPTRLIAASIRSEGQVADLAGVDTITIPAKVASDAHGTLSGDFTTNADKDIRINIHESQEPFHFEKLWAVTADELALALDLGQNVSQSGEELQEKVRSAGYADMFPVLSDEDRNRIKQDGKIPDHNFWKDRIKSGQVAVDTLLNLAGLASFTTDQQQLDDRIAGIIH